METILAGLKVSLVFSLEKLIHLHKWLDKTGESINGASFYSDSYNDLPMLELVDRPFVVNGDSKLQTIAQERGWPSLDWT